jgi:hypothetical protein
VDDNETAPGTRRKLKVSHILILLLLIAVCAFAVFRLNLRFKLRARIDAIRAAGYPVTLTELNEWYTIPENAENAAYTIIDAFSYYQLGDQAKLKSLPIIGKDKLPARTEPLTEETKALATQYTADNQQALELLHEAAAIKHCRYPVDLSIGHTPMPYISDIRRSVHLLGLEAVLHAENNKPRLAARSVTSIFGIAHSLAKEPLLISQLVCTACQEIATSSLERVINRAEFTDEQLVKLTQTVSNAEDLSTISWAFAGERCAGISMFKNPASLSLEGDGYKIPSTLILELYKALGLADRDAVIYLDLINDCMETTQLPLHQRQRTAGTIEAKFKATSKNHILLYAIMPAFSRIISINISSIAHLRTARVALAVQRYRLATGNLPDTLEDLVPTYLDTVPKDPFDGRSLRYEKLETGFIVYSLGLDGVDDGGTERQTGKRKKSQSSWDITFIVER